MSCDTTRKRLWRKLGLNVSDVEIIFRGAKDTALQNKPTKNEKKVWMDKTERLFTVFEYHELPLPVHSKTGLPRTSSMAGYAAVWDELVRRDALGIEVPTGINRDDLVKFLTRLGEFAVQHNTKIELAVLGGAAMVLGYSTRVATLDIDAVFLEPVNKNEIREMVKTVAKEFDIAEDWLNDAAQGFLKKIKLGKVVFSSPGIYVRILSPEQLLASKLGAWRSKKDRMDAAYLLKEFKGLSQEQVWNAIEPFLTPHQELKSHLAFLELWERLYANQP